MKLLFHDGHTGRTVRMGLCLLVFTVSGCAHTKLLKQGDGFAEQGRYELAMQQYDRALQIKPDRETRDKFKHAQVGFRHWLSTISVAADNAYGRNQKGRALLLYAKVLAGNLNQESNPKAESRFLELHTELSAQSLLHVKAHYSAPDFGYSLEAEIEDILPIEQDYSGLPNEREFTFELRQSNGKITEWDEELAGEYVSGTHLVRNPEMLHLQDQVHHLNHQVKELRRAQAKHEYRIEDAENLIAQIQEEQNGDDDTDQDTERDSEELKQAESRLDRARRKLRKAVQKMEHHQDRLHHTVHRLSITPATVVEDIYSTHAYIVTHSSYELEGEVVVTEADRRAAHPLQVVSKDIYHDAQPLLDLAADPLTLLSEQQLRIELRDRARAFAQDYIRGEVQDYRSSLLAAANRAIVRDSRIEKLVCYALSGRDGVSPAVAGKMAQQLQSDYGIEGEFPINALLYDI